MPGRSRVDHGASPSVIDVPREYNAAFHLLARNTEAGRAGKCAYIDDDGGYTWY